MTVVQIFLLILLLEVIFLFFCLFVLVVERGIRFGLDKSRKRKEEKISAWILQNLQQRTLSKKKGLPVALRSPKRLLSVMSAFDLRFQGEPWEGLKKELMEKWVLPKARKWSRSLFWYRRYLAAKSFFLHRQLQDMTRVFHLMQDPMFFVSSTASYAGVRQEDKKAVELVLRKISRFFPYEELYFKDLLLQGSNQVFTYVEELLEENLEGTSVKALEMKIACLTLLASKNIPLHHSLLQKGGEVKTKHPKLRLAWIALHAKNPQEGSETILLQALADPVSEVRREAAYGLQRFPSASHRKKLQELLSDQSWQVRLQAASSLLKMGKEGKKILQEELRSSNQQKKQVASYVLYLSQELA